MIYIMDFSNFGENINKGFQNLGDNIRNVGNNVGERFSSTVPSNKYFKASKEFLESNSLVAKFAFLLLVIIVFLFLLRILSTIIASIMSPSGNQTIIKGSKDGRQAMVVPQDPKVSGSKTIVRSVNQQDGIEFTWSTWVLIDDLEYKKGLYKHIFHKGNDKFTPENVAFPNNAPGLYIHPNKNALVLYMNTFDDINEEIIIDDIPLNKWISVVIRVDGRNVDVYINGNLKVRHKMRSVVKQNYGDVYVSMQGGFSGLISSLKYYNKGLSTMEIYSIDKKGPDLTMDKDLKVFPPYFSLRWYLQ